MNSNNFIKALESIETDRNVNKDVVMDALKEALAKAYRKQIESPDALVRVEFAEDGQILMYHQMNVVENVEFDDIELSLEEAKDIKKDAKVGDVIEESIDVDELGRAAALLCKNVLKQKIREAEKLAVYDEYINNLDEMVLGNVESVEEKFVVVNLGKTLAVMPKAAQIPNEHYYEGQKIRVVITEVNKETKGAQVLVSRSDARLVRRLFEKEVPEIYTGQVEIKAIAREAGERTKMAVYSKNPDIDPIGACIGPRGTRVQVVIEELKGEKIDVFEWSDDIEQLIRNALAPAEIIAVCPALEGKGLLVVVDESQLSLAIGKKGKNARLAVKLTNSRIDIKTNKELDEQGVDYKQLAFEFAIEQEKLKRERAAAELERIRQEQAEKLAALEAQKALEKELAEVKAEVLETEEEPVTVEVEEVKKETKKQVKVTEEKEVEKVEKRAKKPLRERTEYVSKFEEFAEAPTQEEKTTKKSKKKNDDSERKSRSADIRKDKDYEIKVEYSDEELAEIEENEALYEEDWDEDIDYDEFDKYYDEEQ